MVFISRFDCSINEVCFVFSRFIETEKISVGPYYFPSTDYNMTMCVTSYVNLRAYPYKPHNPLDASTTEPVCYTDLPVRVEFDILSYLQRKKKHLSFTNTAQISLSMVLNTVYLNGISKSNLPDCLKFDIAIIFDNSKGDGRMCVDLNIKEKPEPCNGKADFCYSAIVNVVLLDFPILVFSISSIILAINRLKHANKLRKDVNAYFKQEQKGRKLSKFEQFGMFCDIWDTIVIIMSFLAIASIIVKLILEHRRGSRTFNMFDNCAIILGTASFLSWISMVRYMNMRKECNFLIETIKIAVFPRIFYFILCVAFLLIGFTFCGWLVLGPYNVKYKDYSTASQTLFALANGDDVYTTFSQVDGNETMMWWYNQIFLYLYVAVFLIVVLNVAIAIFNDACEDVKKIYELKEEGLPVNKIEEFLLEEPTVGKVDVTLSESSCCWDLLCCCCPNREKQSARTAVEIASGHGDGQIPNESTPLINPSRPNESVL